MTIKTLFKVTAFLLGAVFGAVGVSAQSPTVTAISPTSGTTAGGTNVTITGTGFTGATGVRMGEQAGITWTIRTSAADNNWRSVTYGNGLFVAVSQNTTGNRVMTSPDGVTWTSRTSAADNGWQGVTYGNDLFVAVSSDGTGNRVMTSGPPAATSVTVVNDTSITATTPAGTVGTASVQVYTAAGTNSANTLFTYATNAAPTVSAVAAGGTAQVGVQLTGSYTYSDGEADAQGTSTFRWVRNSVNTGVGGGTDVAVTQNYTAVNADQANYLYFCVTPKAQTGTVTGLEVCSLATAAVSAAAVNGLCGSAANVASAFKPTSNLCAVGSTLQGLVSSTSPWAWSCAGTGGGTVASCTAPNGSTASGTGAARAEVTAGGWGFDLTGTNGGVPKTAGLINATGNAKSPGSTPPGVTFPHGLYDFTLTGGAGPATVVLTYPTALAAGTVYWKFGKTPTNATPAWYQFPGAVISGDRLSITLTLTDGALGDDDATANGEITDPGGPGFTDATSIPTLSEWGLILLASLMAMFGLANVRRRQQG